MSLADALGVGAAALVALFLLYALLRAEEF